jgi:hypothetical protein
LSFCTIDLGPEFWCDGRHRRPDESAR